MNEFPPSWAKEIYDVDVKNGQEPGNITQLVAFDQDGSEDFATICSYELLTPNVPFTIDNTGTCKLQTI